MLKIGDKVKSNTCPTAPGNEYRDRIGKVIDINNAEYPITVKVKRNGIYGAEELAFYEDELELIK
jgi:hypothetical protein